MNITIDIIINFIKLFVNSIYVYYCFRKMANVKKFDTKNLILIFIISFILAVICTTIRFFMGSIVSMVVLALVYGIFLGVITKNKIEYTMSVSILSYAICTIFLFLSTIIVFLPYRFIGINNQYLNLCVILLGQFALIYRFFKVKRFRKGFDFLHENQNNEFASILLLNISIALILIACLIGAIFENIEEVRRNLLFTLIVLSCGMIVVIQKTLKMYYKQKLLEDTMKEYEHEIKEKDAKIEELTNEKFKISKISHEFYNRQKALEILVKENYNMKSETSEEIVSKNILDIVKNLTNEYTEEFKKNKKLSKLEETGIIEIDAMFKYMQSECEKNGIEFKLKIIGNIYILINNIIPKDRLETLIGDHLRDAINAVKASDNDNNEIFVILGVKDGKYELSIYDTGIEFEISTLLRLGTEAVTTYKGKGGSGIGFLTTFETMTQTKASLIISEQPLKSHYTKSVTIRFDGKNEYKICSYRADEISEKCNNKRIVIEKT